MVDGREDADKDVDAVDADGDFDDLVIDDGPLDDLLPVTGKASRSRASGESEADEDLPREIVATRHQVVLQSGGPLCVSGEVQLFDADGELISEESECLLCRCGASRHKPFCDGSHEADAFDDAGEINGQCEEHQLIVNADAALKVRCRRDGPFIFQGPITLSSANGEQQLNREKVALCRCGASSSKPFCDGSHKALGFSAD